MNDSDQAEKVQDEVSKRDADFFEELVNDHDKFNDYVYFSSMEEAIEELNRRRNDKELQKKVEEYFSDVGIPEQFQNEPRLVLFRQVSTPNIEVSRFLIVADGVDIKPLFLEYHDDKFTSNNKWKWYLGKLAFYEGVGKNGGAKISYRLVIDFVQSDGERFKDVKTFWNEPIIDFHRRLFLENYNHINLDSFFDGTEWFKKRSLSAKIYYNQVLGLFITNGILLENFVINSDEKDFIKNIFLPAFKNLYEFFGVKPIIVTLSPTEIENEEFWSCQNPNTKREIEKIINKYSQ